MKRITITLLLVAVGVFFGAVLWAAAVVRAAARGRTYMEVRAIPRRHVGLVLGCAQRLPDGGPNPYFRSRVAAAAELYRAGRIDVLLASGESHADGYNEAADLKASLIQDGVPAGRIYCDAAGFRTLDSVVRAREIFGQTAITIISQETHNRRAIFIAAHRGIDAIGFNAAAVATADSSWNRWRERLANVYAVLDIFVFRTRPRLAGPKVELGPFAADQPDR
jgi:SanA protein